MTVRAGERVLLDDVTWQLGPGDGVGLVGANGSGKTTLLRVLAGAGVGGGAGSGASSDGPHASGKVGGEGFGPGGSPASSSSTAPNSTAALGPSLAASPSSGAGGASGLAASSSGLEVRGRVVRGKTVRLGYLAQDDAELDLGMSAREAVAEVRGNLLAGEGAGSAGQLLELLGLRGDTQFTPARELLVGSAQGAGAAAAGGRAERDVAGRAHQRSRCRTR